MKNELEIQVLKDVMLWHSRVCSSHHFKGL